MPSFVGAWGANNGGPLFTVAAVRVGCDPEEIWRRSLKAMRPSPSGFIWQGIESLMFYPAVLQEMMLQSHENVLRLFRCWPRKSQPNASFHDLWAYGAFRCSAALNAGVVADIQIVSEKGRECVVENPWHGRSVALIRDGQKAEVLSGDRLRFRTVAGETVCLDIHPAP